MNTSKRNLRPQRPPRPEFADIPEELRLIQNWLCWRYSKRPNSSGKYGKVPYSIADRKADYTDRKQWLAYDVAIRQYDRGGYDGVGIVLAGGLVGLDEDGCITPAGLTEAASRNIRLLNSYAEESVSGDGCHALAFGTLPEGRRKDGSHELYCSRRFFVVTGRHIPSSPKSVEYRESELHALHELIFGKPVDHGRGNSSGGPPNSPATTSDQPRSTGTKTCPTHDAGPETISTRAIANTPGDRTVENLYVTQWGAYTREEKEKEEERGSGVGEAPEGCEEGVPTHSDQKIVGLLVSDEVAARYWTGYPRGMNPSRADWALAMKLAFYCHRDVDQMTRLFCASGLYGRRKHKTLRGDTDYVRYTMERACRAQDAVWRPANQSSETKREVGRKISDRTGRVLQIAAQRPEFSPADIARALGMNDSTAVRVILHRQRRRLVNAPTRPCDRVNAHNDANAVAA